MSSRISSYCANYYGAINCHNKVTQFGDRCKLCTVMNEGASSRYNFTNPFSLPSYSSTDSSRDNSPREDRRGRTRERSGKAEMRVPS